MAGGRGARGPGAARGAVSLPKASSAASVERALRLALLLAKAGEEGWSVETLLLELDCSRPTLYRALDHLRAAGWPVQAVREGCRVLYRLRGGLRLR